jgi:hydroxymethylpyrimidine pyrophosphatase-like HAD family hydrolase
MKKDKLVIAIDFDGTLCKYAFPKIGEQEEQHKQLMQILIDLRQKGNKLILWTNRGDNEEYKSLTEAIDWCKEKGLEFDSINQNLLDQKKLSGYSPKIIADYYIDDKALEFNTNENKIKTLSILLNL